VKRRTAAIFFGLVAGSALVTWLFWRGVTFSARLSDDDLEAALSPAASVRQAEHGLEEVTRRHDENRPGMDRWARHVVEASRRAEIPVRRVAAWSMQWDVARPEYGARLREMIASDPDPTVRRNAAVSLARARDPAARPVLRSMLEPWVVTAPVAGTIVSVLPPGRRAQLDGMVARIETSGGGRAEASTPVPGQVIEAPVPEGGTVTAGARVATLAPDPDHAFNAAGGLFFVGTADDIPLLEMAAGPHSGLGPRVASQARAAIQAIREAKR
jgi:hypothetical protein